ncbi:MAG: ATP-binding cassette domain-containing protein, partial [Pseudomonadota bacterium]
MGECKVAFLELTDVCKSFGEGADKTDVLKNLNLAVEEGEFVAIVGFSGSGKTTLISTIAGLEAPDSGSAVLKGEEIHAPGPDRGVVF